MPTTLSPDAEGPRATPEHLEGRLEVDPAVAALQPEVAVPLSGAGVLLLGIAGMAWLLPGNRTVGGIGFDVSTLLYFGLAVVVGLQAVYFFLMRGGSGSKSASFPTTCGSAGCSIPERWSASSSQVPARGVRPRPLGLRPFDLERSQLRASELPAHAPDRHPWSHADRLRSADPLAVVALRACSGCGAAKRLPRDRPQREPEREPARRSSGRSTGTSRSKAANEPAGHSGEELVATRISHAGCADRVDVPQRLDLETRFAEQRSRDPRLRVAGEARPAARSYPPKRRSWAGNEEEQAAAG